MIARGTRCPRLAVGIQHPLDRDAIAARVRAGDLAVATSGAYERGAHIATPHGARARRRAVGHGRGPDLGTADAYSTAAFAMGAARPGLDARARTATRR